MLSLSKHLSCFVWAVQRRGEMLRQAQHDVYLNTITYAGILDAHFYKLILAEVCNHFEWCLLSGEFSKLIHLSAFTKSARGTNFVNSERQVSIAGLSNLF